MNHRGHRGKAKGRQVREKAIIQFCRPKRRFLPPYLMSSSVPSVVHAFLFLALLGFTLCSCAPPPEIKGNPVTRALAEDEIDAALQRAALSALGTRDGSIIVMDPQTGRLRAIVNARIAFEEAVPPGSTIKPFTALAALRAGLIDAGSRMLCHERYRRGDFETHCSHPRLKPPFSPAQALAYSCNYYFSKLGERLSEEPFDTTLADFGFGAPTGSDDAEEARGLLPRGGWRVQNALGESRQVLVTPVQLITAYAALFNGGHLYIPQQAAPQSFTPRLRAALEIDPAHRELLLQGMRGAVVYGTAARTGLNLLPQYIFGKTGTSTPLEDFHSQGWFVGFAADQGSTSNVAPTAIHLAVLVFLKHAHGAQCAELSRAVFEEYDRVSAKESQPRPLDYLSSGAGRDVRSSSLPSQVRVHLLREDVTKTVSLDEYVFGVLAAEGSLEDEHEALKAQAVITRNYALKNLARHAHNGYDFCNSTHCQRYITVRDEGARADFYELLHRALRETAGETLRDEQGRIVDAYFSADCGGATANAQSLWERPAPVYLRGVHDDYCANSPYRNWTDTIPLARLAKALRTDPRSDVGARLDNVRVVKRDATGRAEMIELQGERRRLLRGWDFKIIVGRALGWNVLKSSRFEVERAGANLIFHGSGFGHGLGLCQTGAHVMAERGATYRQILNFYLPGTSVSGNENRPN